MKQSLTIKGMHCKSCVMLVTDALTDAGVKDIVIVLDEKAQKAKLTCVGDKTKIINAVKKEGYEVS